MAIAFAGVALLTGLTLGFKRIDKSPQNADTTGDASKKTDEENVAGDAPKIAEEKTAKNQDQKG
jgi:hypothetical protein